MNRGTMISICVSLLLVFLFYNMHSSKFETTYTSDAIESESYSYVSTKPNFLFLKTHKTGSSTLGSIFFLYGVKRKLNFVLPPYTGTLMDVNEEFVETLLPPRPGQTWNIQSQHCRFNRDFQHLVLPKETTFYTSVTRSPISHFKSTFSFFGHEERLREEHGDLNDYDELVNIYLDETCSTIDADEIVPVSNGCLELNTIARDLGWTWFTEQMEHLSVQQRLDKFIEMLDEELDFVMITDKMDESLVVLKNLLGWDMTDILYLNKKVTERKSNSDITEKTNQRLLKAMELDRQIFMFFSYKFDFHVKRIGKEEVSAEVQQFITMRQNFEDLCFDKNEGTKPVCVDCPNENLGRTVTWELSQYGKTENLACAFLHTDFRLYPRVVSDLLLSGDYSDSTFKYLLSTEDRGIKEVIQKMVYSEK